jgi:mRNA interferase RelE/StbE
VAWTVTLAPPARKALKAIRDKRLRGRIVRTPQGLETDPRPAGAKRLAGQEGLLRLRVGDWRILYELREREVVVLVVRIGPRGEVYERLG